MNKLFNGHFKYLFLIPIILMIGFILFYQYTLADIRQQISDGIMIGEHLAIDLNLLTTGIVIQAVVTFFVNTAFVGLLCYLGNIYRSRNGAKWRSPL